VSRLFLYSTFLFATLERPVRLVYGEDKVFSTWFTTGGKRIGVPEEIPPKTGTMQRLTQLKYTRSDK
jgi:hypothetical protein